MPPTPIFPLANLPPRLFTTPIPESIPHEQIANDIITRLAENDASVIAANHAHWRDMLALTSTLRTFNSSTAFKAAWNELAVLNGPRDFKYADGSAAVMRTGPIAVITAKFHFTNSLEPNGRCIGFLTIAPELEQVNGDQASPYKVFALSTILESIDGYGDPDVFPSHLLNGSTQTANGTFGRSFDALVVGLGPSGLSTIARLKALGLNAIACDKIPAVGMNWTERYSSLKLHTPKMQNTLPFNFKPPKDAPYYLDVNDLKRYYQSFVDEYKLKDSLWLSTAAKHASYDKATGTWSVTLLQSGQERIVSARHLIFCTGMTGRVPKQPSLPGRENFSGTALHAVDYINAKSWAGKRGVVVGTANTGHDVAEDMANAGMHVTMVQRSSTPVLNTPNLFIHKVYHDKVDVIDTDKWFHTNPVAIDRVIMKPVSRMMAMQDKEKYDRLEARGFKVDREADLVQILYERGGRHYMDINMKSESTLAEYTAHGLKFADGSEILADVIVFATGYYNDMKVSASRLLDPEVAETLDETWYLDEEGNLRGAWKPIGHPNIWFCPGDISHSRFFSRFIALQVKAEVEGTPFVPYEKRF